MASYFVWYTLLGAENEYLREEIFGGTVVGDGFLVGWDDHDGEVGGDIEVVLVAQHCAREFLLFARVPL